MNYSKYILLTGAGFTKNFGCPLAHEMYSEIFNDSRIQSQNRLRSLLLDDFDYESIFHKIISSDYTNEEKKAINDVIFDAYHAIDEIVTEWNFTSGSPNPVNIYGVNKLIERFSGRAADTAGFFFTLNQDFFIERHFSSVIEGLVCPGITKIIPDAYKINIKSPVEKVDFIKLPTQQELERNINLQSSRTIYYIKLHGSFGWLSANGQNAYVIGREKDTQIIAEPLLFYYFNLLKKVLSKQDSRLLIIGYGFNDKHINQVISNAITESGLKIFIISPINQQDFIKQFKEKEYSDTLLTGLKGYFPYRLLDIFPENQSETHAWQKIIETYFQQA
jgi:hypothetical protein